MKNILYILALLSLHVSFGAITGADIDESIIDVTYYVDKHHPAASDSNIGTNPAAPFATFEKGVESGEASSVAGNATKVIVSPGLYREYGITVSGGTAPLIIEGTRKGDVIISGGQIWTTGWSAVSGYDDLYEHDWYYNIGFGEQVWWSRGVAVAADAMRSEGICVNGKLYMPRLLERYNWEDPDGYTGPTPGEWVYYKYEGLDVLTPGTFGVVEAVDADPERPLSVNNKIFIKLAPGDSIDTAVIEMILFSSILRITRNNVVVRNLTFRHNRGFITSGPPSCRFYGSNTHVEDCLFYQNGSGGASFGNKQDDISIIRSRFIENGSSGFGCSYPDNMLMMDVECSQNNWRGDVGGWHGWSVAGAKIMGPGEVGNTTGVRVVRYRAMDNLAHGLWFDHGNEAPGIVQIEDSWFSHNNYGANLYIEKQSGPITISNSFFWSNADTLRGIYAVAQTVTVDSCVIKAENTEAVYLNERSNSDFKWSHDWFVTGTTFLCTTPQSLIYRNGTASHYAEFVSTFKGVGNLYYNTETTNAFNVAGFYAQPLVDWQTQTGSDTDAVWRNPHFYGNGRATLYWWTNIYVDSIAGLTSAPAYKTASHDIAIPLPCLETPRRLTPDSAGHIYCYLTPPDDGVYTFHIAGSQAAELYLGTNSSLDTVSSTPILTLSSPTSFRDWSLHSSAAYTLKRGETYPCKILYVGGSTGDCVSIAWTHPGKSSPELISGAYISEFLRTPDTVQKHVEDGLFATICTGNFTTLPSFETIMPYSYVLCSAAYENCSVALASTSRAYAVEFTGFFNAPNDGIYTFICASRNGVKCSIGDINLIHNDGILSQIETADGSIGLRKGTHIFTLEYLNPAIASNAELRLQVVFPDGTTNAVENALVSRYAAPELSGGRMEMERALLASDFVTSGNGVASGGSIIELHDNRFGDAFFHFTGEPGEYDITCAYFDERDGITHASLYADDTQLFSWEWTGTNGSGSASLDSYTTMTFTVELQSPAYMRYSAYRITGWEPARTDYIEFFGPIPEPSMLLLSSTIALLALRACKY